MLCKAGPGLFLNYSHTFSELYFGDISANMHTGGCELLPSNSGYEPHGLGVWRKEDSEFKNGRGEWVV